MEKNLNRKLPQNLLQNFVFCFFFLNFIGNDNRYSCYFFQFELIVIISKNTMFIFITGLLSCLVIMWNVFNCRILPQCCGSHPSVFIRARRSTLIFRPREMTKSRVLIITKILNHTLYWVKGTMITYSVKSNSKTWMN